MNGACSILMVASENDGLPNAKVGGIGDVVRDAPPALARHNCTVTVVTPSYGFLHTLPGSREVRSLHFMFSGKLHRAVIYEVPGKQPVEGVAHLVVDHPRFESYDKERGGYQIYCFDPPETPYATDATKYALFSVAVAQAIKENVCGHIDCVHLHDWHAAFLLILRNYDPAYRMLRSLRTVYTIHNLSLQGVRPFEGSDSSLDAWYPHLRYAKSRLADPRWPDCVNPMAVGIRLSDAVHTVSPSYAEEILNPSDPPRYYGGEGLEADLKAAKEQGRLFGILNGCEYPPTRVASKGSFHEFVRLLQRTVLGWAGKQDFLSASHFVAYTRLEALSTLPSRPDMILTSVGRLVDQKVYLMKASGTRHTSGLEGILKGIGTRGVYILIGTGDRQYERFFTEMSARFGNLVFLNAYSDECSSALYAHGDLFLMPSSFEPCGISQMLAMRDGQPCLAHKVGGLKDTVKEGINGFTFEGATVEEQVDNLVDSCVRAALLKTSDPSRWQQICRGAYDSRFLWEHTVAEYMQKLYRRTRTTDEDCVYVDP